MFKQSVTQYHLMRLLRAAAGNRGLLRIKRFAVLCAVLLLGSAGMLAQEPATSFDQLSLVLEKGDKITLFDSSGNKITGRINRLAPDGFDLKVSGKIQTFQEKDIRQITRNKPDSPLNGFLIGAGVGFGATLPLYLAVADYDEKGLAVAASVLWGLIGGGIGALVDASIHEKKLVYLRPKGKVAWTISPYYSSQSQTSGAHAVLIDFPPYTGIKPSKGFRLTIRF